MYFISEAREGNDKIEAELCIDTYTAFKATAELFANSALINYVIAILNYSESQLRLHMYIYATERDRYIEVVLSF